jgi:hypothetical protein
LFSETLSSPDRSTSATDGSQGAGTLYHLGNEKVTVPVTL